MFRGARGSQAAPRGSCPSPESDRRRPPPRRWVTPAKGAVAVGRPRRRRLARDARRQAASGHGSCRPGPASRAGRCGVAAGHRPQRVADEEQHRREEADCGGERQHPTSPSAPESAARMPANSEPQRGRSSLRPPSPTRRRPRGRARGHGVRRLGVVGRDHQREAELAPAAPRSGPGRARRCRSRGVRSARRRAAARVPAQAPERSPRAAPRPPRAPRAGDQPSRPGRRARAAVRPECGRRREATLRRRRSQRQ